MRITTRKDRHTHPPRPLPCPLTFLEMKRVPGGLLESPSSSAISAPQAKVIKRPGAARTPWLQRGMDFSWEACLASDVKDKYLLNKGAING